MYVLPYGQMSLWAATVITNLLSSIPVFGVDLVELIWGGFSVCNATLNRFFSLHYILPFVLAALAVAHMIALHFHGSNNPNGLTSNGDRYAMYPYFIFKDLVTIFAFFLALSIIVFFYPTLMGQNLWPYIKFLIVNIIFTCAICWKYILYYLFINCAAGYVHLVIIKLHYNAYVIFKSKIIVVVLILITNIVKIYNKTIFVSGLFLIKIIRKFIIFIMNPDIVRYFYKIYNQQITKVINNYLLWVGISETLRTHKKNYINNHLILRRLSIKNSNNNNNGIIKDSHNNEISLKFREWFAGITDGDGYLYVNKNGNVGYELTLATEDEKVLRIIQNKFGGNVHARGGYKAVRYRTQNRDTMYKIVHCLNGLVINNVRLAQLHKVCLALNIPIKDPIIPTIDSSYISGLLDSDGTINFYKQTCNDTYRYQLTISITNKSRSNLDFLLNVIGGNIYFDKGKNGSYKWSINSKLLHLKLYDYFLKFPPKTIKGHRTFLIKEFHDLNSKKVYLDEDKSSINYKIWQNFKIKWDSKN